MSANLTAKICLFDALYLKSGLLRWQTRQQSNGYGHSRVHIDVSCGVLDAGEVELRGKSLASESTQS